MLVPVSRQFLVLRKYLCRVFTCLLIRVEPRSRLLSLENFALGFYLLDEID